MKKIILPLVLSTFLLTACGGDEAPAEPEKKEAAAKKPKKKDDKAKNDKAALAEAEAASIARRDALELERQQQGIVIIGDSLSSGEGLSSDQAWVGLLEKRLGRSEPVIPVVNLSMSSNDASGGVSRIGWQIRKYSPRLIVVSLGSRDFAKEADLATVQKDLSTVIRTAKANNAQVLLVGASAPPTANPDYQAQVNMMYRALAAQEKVLLVPDLMAPLSRITSVNPEFTVDENSSREIQPALLDHVWPALYMVMKQGNITTSLPAPPPAPAQPAIVAPPPVAPKPAEPAVQDAPPSKEKVSSFGDPQSGPPVQND